jgi:hypothetical protein
MELIFTDKPLDKTEYTMEEITGDYSPEIMDNDPPRIIGDGPLEIIIVAGVKDLHLGGHVLKRAKYVFSNGYSVKMPFLNEYRPSKYIDFVKRTREEVYDITGDLLPGLETYETHISCFNYWEDHPLELKEYRRAFLEWFFSVVREHLRKGAKEFRYAAFWYDDDPKTFKTETIDLATFVPDENEFAFRWATIYEFIDSVPE